MTKNCEELLLPSWRRYAPPAEHALSFGVLPSLKAFHEGAATKERSRRARRLKAPSWGKTKHRVGEQDSIEISALIYAFWVENAPASAETGMLA